ncbi:MAG: heterodisulfide reductase-related iron-sulfur binding cluster [Alphaproteobacteria bacterium]
MTAWGSHDQSSVQRGSTTENAKALAWQDPAFYDLDAIDKELARVFDICHGRRRFTLRQLPAPLRHDRCSPSGELDGVPKERFRRSRGGVHALRHVLHDEVPLCAAARVRPTSRHLMLRAWRRAKAGYKNFTTGQLAEMDRNAALAGPVAPIANWATKVENRLTRPAMETALGIDSTAKLPKFHGKTFVAGAKTRRPQASATGPARARKVALFPTCFVNYNNPKVGHAALEVLARQGIEPEIVYDGCCGMPFLEQGDLPRVAKQAEKIAKSFRSLIDDGYTILTLTASCGLMLKFEWPLLLPGNEDVQALSRAVMDIDQFIVDIAGKEGLAPGMKPVAGGVTIHLACHARAQNIGPRGAEMLRLLPGTKVEVVERCAGHGGTFGVMKKTHPLAMKVGKPAMRAALKAGTAHLVSECPLAAAHLVAGMKGLAEEGPTLPSKAEHPIEILARAYASI